MKLQNAILQFIAIKKNSLYERVLSKVKGKVFRNESKLSVIQKLQTLRTVLRKVKIRTLKLQDHCDSKLIKESSQFDRNDQ